MCLGGVKLFRRMKNGWALAKDSWGVLKQDKELVLFPIFSGIACLCVMASFAVPLWATGILGELKGGDADTMTTTQQVIGGIVLFAYYFVNYFVIIFFNTALISCAITRFRGGDPTFSQGVSAAVDRLPQIVGWALVSATVGLILKLIESRSERIGTIIASVIGMAWSAMTYFVVPIIVVERAGPIAAAQRSLQILRKTWGESLVANFGIGLFVLLASLVGVVFIALGVVAIGAQQFIVGGIAIGLGVVWILAVSLVSSAMNAVVIGALYLYASEGTVAQQFDANSLESAFRHGRVR